jgi:hypothetical protein
MSSTRLSNDPCYIQGVNQQNVGMLRHIIDPSRFVNCKPCRNELGLVGGTTVSIASSQNLVDIASGLFGIMQPTNRCQSSDQQPQPLTNATQPPVKHLSGCMIHTFRPVPLPPPMKPFSCDM